MKKKSKLTLIMFHKPRAAPGLRWASRLGPLGPRLLGTEPGLLFAEIGFGESGKGKDKSAPADFDV